jgi:uncharacterized protein (TIGR00290 family)
MIAACLFSGGKESVHAIATVEKQGIEIKYLIYEIPTFPSPHAQNLKALKTLAKSLNKNFLTVDLNKGEQELINTLKNLKIDALVAGDINVPEHVAWLQNICSQAGIKLLEPLWGKNTSLLFEEMFSDPHFKATIIGINTKHLSEQWLGFTLSHESAKTFLAKNPKIDPLGENGEFHTIVIESALYKNTFKTKALKKIAEKDAAYLSVTLSETKI